MEKLVGIILMAGLSTRFGGPKNKQLCLLNGKPVFQYSIDAFANNSKFDKIIIAVNEDNKDIVESYLKEKDIKATVVLGGKTRQESVENALKSVKNNDYEVVVIHDAARPLVDVFILNQVIKAAIGFGAATSYVDVTDTVAIKSPTEEITGFAPRQALASIQTPQAFKLDLLLKAHENAKTNGATDDCSLVLALPHTVKLVKGDKKYHKVTTPEDIKYLEGLLK